MAKRSADLRSMGYITHTHFFSKWAHCIQSAKMAQAFSKQLEGFELITLGDLSSFFTGNKIDPKQWFGLSHDIKVTRLPLLFKINYPIRKLNIPRYYGMAVLYAYLRRFDLVYTRKMKIAQKALKLGMRVLMESHDLLDPETLRSEAFHRENFLGFVTTVGPLADNFLEHGVPEEKVLQVPNGVDLEQFDTAPDKESAREITGLPQDRPIAVYSGHLYENRGVEEIFEAAIKMPKVLFLFIGGWEQDVEKRRNEARKKGLKNVILKGFVPNQQVPIYLSCADLILMPYSAKVYTADYMHPLKMSEYMAAQKPIVASDLPAIKQVLKHGKNAILVEPDNPDSLQKGIQVLIENPDMAKSLALQAYQDIQWHTWDRRAERVLKFARERME